MSEVIYSEFRKPRQMLGTQEYDGHLSIHDDKMAGDLGFSGAPIEGPTHFSQFVRLLHKVYGDEWFFKGLYQRALPKYGCRGGECSSFCGNACRGKGYCEDRR